MERQMPAVQLPTSEVVAAPMMTVAAIKQRADAIKGIMSQAMTPGVDYGVIAKGMKPTLLKAGAEKLMLTFQIAPEVFTEDLSGADFVRYRCKVSLLTSNGAFLGDGIGECSTREDKYMWQKAFKAEYDNAPEDARREVHKSGKNGAWTEYQVRQNPWNLANTVLKMAKKRALVDAVLTVLAASDIFTQDVEDMDITEHTEQHPEVNKETGEVVEKARHPHPSLEKMRDWVLGNCKAIGWDNTRLWNEFTKLQPDATNINDITEESMATVVKMMNEVHDKMVKE